MAIEALLKESTTISQIIRPVRVLNERFYGHEP
jgi:hypothetical protein